MGVRLPAWTARPQLLTRLALASVVVNVLIVVTGGAVRLTGSGLGCPTWPSCTEKSLVPTKEYASHGIIEFTNRQLTWLVSLVVLASLLVALRQRRQRMLALLLAATIPAQAVLGGLSVLTHLNPWLVAAHFLFSSVIIAIAFTLWWRVKVDRPVPAGGPGLTAAAWLLVGLTAAVLMVGTVVTGSGPHAGASTDSGVTHRMHFAPSSVAQLHADLVMLLIGVTVGFAVLARAAGGSERVQRASWLLLGLELAQGLIGFVQYFTHVPAVLVGIHMLGACLVWLAALVVPANLGRRPFRATSGDLSVATPAPRTASLPVH